MDKLDGTDSLIYEEDTDNDRNYMKSNAMILSHVYLHLRMPLPVIIFRQAQLSSASHFTKSIKACIILSKALEPACIRKLKNHQVQSV